MDLGCEYYRHPDSDVTGENGVMCGAEPVAICKSCGPLCKHCLNNEPCFEAEGHELVREEVIPMHSGSTLEDLLLLADRMMAKAG